MTRWPLDHDDPRSEDSRPIARVIAAAAGRRRGEPSVGRVVNVRRTNVGCDGAPAPPSPDQRRTNASPPPNRVHASLPPAQIDANTAAIPLHDA